MDMENAIICAGDSTCPIYAQHTVILDFTGGWDRRKAIPVCDNHLYPYNRVQPGDLLPGMTAVRLVSVTRDTFYPAYL